MGRPDEGFAAEIGDGPGDLDDTGVCTGGKAQLVDDFLDGGFTGLIQGTELLHVAAGHLRVGEDALAPEPFLLALAGCQDPSCDDGGGLSFSAPDQGGGTDRPDPKLDISTTLLFYGPESFLIFAENN